MKTRNLLLTALVSALFFSCSDDDITDIGSSIQPASDKIIVAAESFDITSEDYFVPYMNALQDSFLLGTFFDLKYGTTHADIFAQVEPPLNFIYPSNMVPDSVLLVMYYNRFFGDKYSPMHLSVYEITGEIFKYNIPYASNIDPFRFSDKTKLLGKKTFTAVDAREINDSSYVIINLTDNLLPRFAQVNTDTYSSYDKFFNFFKGIYITPEFGSATMLYVKALDMEYYYHYTYQAKGILGQDTTITVNSMVTFPANELVRQVNRFLHPDTAAVRTRLNSQTEQVHYISSPANVYTRVKLPMKNMQQKLEANGKRLAINNAKLRVDIAEIDEADFSQPIPANILLIRESEINTFFTKRFQLPNETTAILGTYSYELNSDNDGYDYFYTFDIAGLISNELINAKKTGEVLNDHVNYLLVPVRLKYDSDNNVNEVAQQFLMNSVTISGGSHSTKPMKARVVFSGF